MKWVHRVSKRIERGVIDTNIEVNEIKTILQQAKDGKFSLSALMNNPTVKLMKVNQMENFVSRCEEKKHND